MRRIVVPAMLVLGSAALAAACGSGSESTTGPDTDLDGAALYSANCAACHGADLGGTDRGPSHLSIVYEPGHHSDDAFRAAISNGATQHHWDFGPMPPVDGLTDDEVDAVIDFVRTEQERQGFER
ncbi:MAG: c-type cytochrome [Acidimicrobiales bacterium]|nr:c-type cytochrome [Acidimicrobiales bacterium]